jgi:cob(I)alamin adenosyltransferase
VLLTGDGKGKTTSALGMALRAEGHGMSVCIIEFIKADANIGEAYALAQHPRIEFIQTGLGFLPKPAHPAFAKHRAAAENGLRKAQEIIASGRCDMVILDEICVAVAKGLLSEADVATVVRSARAGSCVILTGRGATPGLIELADTATEMRCLKHGMQSGIPAQKGVEM